MEHTSIPGSIHSITHSPLMAGDQDSLSAMDSHVRERDEVGWGRVGWGGVGWGGVGWGGVGWGGMG